MSLTVTDGIGNFGQPSRDAAFLFGWLVVGAGDEPEMVQRQIEHVERGDSGRQGFVMSGVIALQW